MHKINAQTKNKQPFFYANKKMAGLVQLIQPDEVPFASYQNGYSNVSADEKGLTAYVAAGVIKRASTFSLLHYDGIAPDNEDVNFFFRIGHNDPFYVCERLKTLYGIELKLEQVTSCKVGIPYFCQIDAFGSEVLVRKMHYQVAPKSQLHQKFKVHRLVVGGETHHWYPTRAD